MAEFTAEVAAADTERRQWWLEKEDTIKECLLGEMELVENEQEEAKSEGVAAVAIEFGNRERLSECLDARRVFEFAFFFLFSFFFLLFQTNNTIQNTVHALFKGPTTTLFIKKILKMDLTILFTHLKIILLQCFQFSVFNFQQQ